MKSLMVVLVAAFLIGVASQAEAYDMCIPIPDGNLTQVVALYVESNPNLKCEANDYNECIKIFTDLEWMEFSIKKDFKGSIKHGKSVLQNRTAAASDIDSLGLE